MAVVLLLTTNAAPTIEFPILRKCTLGRSSACDLTVDDQKMSGKHGMFEFDDKGQLFYTDLGSTNGSFLNNSQIQKIQFKVDETLLLGNTSILIDNKRLTPRERMAIGRGISPNEDRTIVIPAHKSTRSIIAGVTPIQADSPKVAETDDDKSSVDQKKSIIVNKDLKKKLPKSDWRGVRKENLIEQEESSGKTKFLKLDINKHKKKP